MRFRASSVAPPPSAADALRKAPLQSRYSRCRCRLARRRAAALIVSMPCGRRGSRQLSSCCILQSCGHKVPDCSLDGSADPHIFKTCTLAHTVIIRHQVYPASDAGSSHLCSAFWPVCVGGNEQDQGQRLDRSMHQSQKAASLLLSPLCSCSATTRAHRPAWLCHPAETRPAAQGASSGAPPSGVRRWTSACAQFWP